MQINNNNNLSFQAKFLKSDSLIDVVNYAIERGKFNKLNQARKNIDCSALTKRIKMDICDEKGYPAVIFTKYEAPNYSRGLNLDEYIPTKQVKFVSSKKMNPLKFALEKIIKLGNNAPENKMYKKLIFTKDRGNSNFIGL